ncbi:HNH endonuclease [Facklamia miroungae]|uniref:HNH endonuclease n=1 Tax=Facklamia miroungae TaxID=120956 RepID=A0A1G7UVE2_9LACT|nr:HNH endonuclease signature motif containing protein [Facklamia miroungae]NKZ30131.1 HNH endonuclease [Facklamia miroungae]SDG51278.1 HNH endonuclease [Facklamia miroungae]
MNVLTKPKFNIQSFYDGLVTPMKKMKNLDENNAILIKPYLLNLYSKFISEENNYDSCLVEDTHDFLCDDKEFVTSKINDITGETESTIILDANDISYLYNRFQKVNKEYKSILSLAMIGRCPYCEKKDADEIDHFFPKKKYPIYSITPNNLIPSCHRCNQYKGEKSLQVIHPYYHDYNKIDWFKCYIEIRDNTLVVTFEVNPFILQSNNIESIRIKNTIKIFHLKSRYQDWSTLLFYKYINTWTNYYCSLNNVDGKGRVIQHIEEKIKEYQLSNHTKNSYQILFLKELANTFDDLSTNDMEQLFKITH